jgi:hypothetical protein
VRASRQQQDTAVDVLIRTIRDWAAQMDLPEGAPVEAACQLAAIEFRAGASVLEACAAARGLIRSYVNHPAYRRAATTGRCGPVPKLGAA